MRQTYRTSARTLTPAQREKALDAAGVTTAEIARRAGCTWQHAMYVRRGERRSPKVEQVIADAIGIPLEKAFPPRATAAA